MKSLTLAMILASFVATNSFLAPALAANAGKGLIKAAKNTPKPQPLVAKLISTTATSLTVQTAPIYGPDGLIPSAQKTYNATSSTLVTIDGQSKTLADLNPGENLRLTLSDDGKSIQSLQARTTKNTAKNAPATALPESPAPTKLP